MLKNFFSAPRSSSGGGGGAPTGPAGGVLSGTYPNPGFAVTPLFTLPTNTTYVDSANGSDVTGLTGRLDKPFATVQAGITASSSNIVWVRKGPTYNEQITMKDGVTVYMEKGATINWQGTTGATITFPAVSGESYFLLGYGSIVNTTTAGGQTAITGGVSGAGRMIIEAEVIAGRGTAGNRAIVLTNGNFDPNSNAIAMSWIKATYVESNNKVSNYAVDINWGGGPGKIMIGTIENLSATAGARALQIQSQAGLGVDNLDVDIDAIFDTTASASIGQTSVQLTNSGGGNTPFTCNIDFISVGNKTALGMGQDVWVRSRVIQNSSSTLEPITGGHSKITGALIQNLSNSSSTVPLINGHDYDSICLFDECRFENPNGNPSTSPMILVRDASSFNRFKNCVFYLASTDTKGLLDLETSASCAFIGSNIIIRRAGTAPSIGSSGTPALQVFGSIFANIDKAAGVSINNGNFVFDTNMTLANSIDTYFA